MNRPPLPRRNLFRTPLFAFATSLALFMFGLFRSVPIPDVLYSEAADAPFERCLQCERALRTAGAPPYLIEKAFRVAPGYGARETLFEYALCLPCYEALSASLSEASRARMQQFVTERVDFAARAAVLSAEDDPDPTRWLDRCVVDGTPAEALGEYQLLAHCQGNRLVLSHLPCLIGGPAIERMTALLSKETRDELGGFQDDLLGPAPDVEELLSGPRPVLL